VVLNDEASPIESMPDRLSAERKRLRSLGKKPGEKTVIHRAHSECPTDKVQRLIAICQEQKFTRFAPRGPKRDAD